MPLRPRRGRPPVEVVRSQAQAIPGAWEELKASPTADAMQDSLIEILDDRLARLPLFR